MQAASGVNDEAVGTPSSNGEGKRRRRSILERRQIVEETLKAGASVARVARAHEVNANQVFAWRRQYKHGLLGEATGLLPVKVTERVPSRPAAGELCASRYGAGATGSIHVAVGKAQIRIEGEVDRDALRMVLETVLR